MLKFTIQNSTLYRNIYMLIRYGMLCDNKELPDIVAELNFWYKEQDAGVKREEPEEVKRQHGKTRNH